MAKKEFGFDLNNNDIRKSKPLIKNKKVTTDRDFSFEDIVHSQKNKQGRPPVYSDKKYKATMPKRISPIVNTKIEALKPLMTELLNTKGNPSFNMMVDVLIESYINQRLSNTKVEFLRKEISEEIEKL